MSETLEIEPIPEQPAWDREAARARYRKLMRSWPMRLSYLLLAVTILFSWVWGLGAMFAPSVEQLPNHDATVPVGACVTCHTTDAAAMGAPPMNHPQAPSCGFCHRQVVPKGLPQTGSHNWLIPPAQAAQRYALH